MKPIIFNTMMVQAILEGRKTQTRRVIKNLPQNAMPVPAPSPWNGFETENEMYHVKPQYRPGDVLWVRETWSTRESDQCHAQPRNGEKCPYESCERPDGPCFPKEYIYKATDSLPEYGGKWHPSIHMPREAARIFLRVTDVRVERLQDIDENGAIAEGLYKGWRLYGRGSLALSARQAFMWLWRIITLHTTAAVSWACNPWVWVYTFERCEPEE